MSENLEAGLHKANGADSDANTESPNSEVSQLVEEMEKPWPSTFERSISLLASPVITAPQADHFTRSPKPGGTPLSGRRAQRGYLTPEQSSLLAPGQRAANDFQKGVQKVQSLDFKSKYNAVDQPIKPLLDTQEEQNKKAMEAKAYRQKLLQAKQEEGAQLSPGYKKEKSIKKAKKDKISLEEKSTFSQAVFNMANILMGVGLLGLPFSLKSAGWGGGIFCVLILGLITWRTSIIIGRELNGDPRPASYFDDSPFKTPLPPGSSAAARMLPPIKSFPDIARASFGEAGCVFLSVVLYFELFSCLCIFLISIGDHLHTMFPVWSTNQHMVVVAAVTILPTVVLRTPRLLSYLSAIGTFSTIAVVLTVVIAAIFEGDISAEAAARSLQEATTTTNEHKSMHHVWDNSGMPIAMGLVAYCFSGHAIVPSIYTSMQKPQEFERMIDLTFMIVLCACLAVGASGYYMFGDAVLDQVTLSLEQNSSAVLVMKILTWLIILTSFSKYILTMYPLALGMEEICAPYLSSHLFVRFASSTIKFILTVLALVVAIYVPSFSFVCALVGMICTMSVSVIFPAAAHLKMFGKKLGFFEKLTDWIMVVIGCLVAVVGTIYTVG
ncbi:acid transporter AVT1F [Seminavis robusta]|uniref:Acid transporter AVT1F n=1 Tax=Seminavis robusta TaxID=568900 RepID=A0A9N8HMU2_9STRA|nr:acid transporter AVT1F [Seminavis robusta]|eukprot:Sro929_g221340.1 acid transporter AVT1F (610) ;mRNA; r:27317-29321